MRNSLLLAVSVVAIVILSYRSLAQEPPAAGGAPIDLDAFRKANRVAELVEGEQGVYSLNLLYAPKPTAKDEFKKVFKNAVAVDFETAVRGTNEQCRKLYAKVTCSHATAIRDMKHGQTSRSTGFRSGCTECRRRQNLQKAETPVWESLWKVAPDEKVEIPLCDNAAVIDVKANGNKVVIAPKRRGSAVVRFFVQPVEPEDSGLGLDVERGVGMSAWTFCVIRVKVLDPSAADVEDSALEIKGKLTSSELLVSIADEVYPGLLEALQQKSSAAEMLLVLELVDKESVDYEFFQEFRDINSRWFVAFVRIRKGNKAVDYARVLFREKAPDAKKFVAHIIGEK
ncbi:MAG: hypothetical protein ACKVX7_06820 [Planctomycetota bacterium]